MKQTTKGLILFMILDLIIGGTCFGFGWTVGFQGKELPPEVLRDNLSQLGEMTWIYNETHPYRAMVWDCSDMAPELWALATMAGFRAQIMVGNPFGTGEWNHAWTVVEVEPGQWVALEGTNGHLYTAPEYLTGHPFRNPDAFVKWYSTDDNIPKTISLSPLQGDGEGWIRNLTPQNQ